LTASGVLHRWAMEYTVFCVMLAVLYNAVRSIKEASAFS